MEIRNLYMEYGDKALFDIESIDVYSEDRIGLIGQNGAGKTTLMEVICGKITPVRGIADVKVPLCYVPQLDEDMLGEISELSVDEWSLPENAKSGGEITRKKLAQAFSTSSRLLLCDEPTTNLDEEGITRLESSLLNYSGSIILISHDRALLDKICNRIWELEGGTLTEYHGNYTDYRTQKDLARKNAWDEYDKYIAEKKHLQKALADRKSKAGSMKSPPKRMGNSEARLHKMDVKKSTGKVEQAATQIKRRLGMRRDDVFKKIEVLSGGERCKASLAKLICGGYPILLLDEPANYLDIFVLEALEDMLTGFDGTVIFVSHDRYFRKKIAEREVEIRNHRLYELEKIIQPKQKDESLMLLEMEKADLVSRMAFPKKGDDRESLEKRYVEVCRQLDENGTERK